MNLILQEGKRLLAHVLQESTGTLKIRNRGSLPYRRKFWERQAYFILCMGENFSIEPCFDQTVLEGTVFSQRENVRHYGADLGGKDHPQPGCPLYYQAFQTIDGRLCQRWDCRKQREGGTSYGFRK